MGGRFKSGDFALLREPLRSRKRDGRGDWRSDVADSRCARWRGGVHTAETLPEAVRRAFDLAPSGGTVLLAPACASFDMFRDYAERGQIFKREVMRLAEEQ